MKTLHHLLPLVILAFARLVLAADAQSGLSLDQALEQLKTYDYGQNDRPLRAIELHVARYATDAARKSELAEDLTALLAAPNTTLAARVFVCQQLLLVGTEAQVPLLAKMLDDPQTTEIARYTLDAIPGEASGSALRDALARLTGPPLIGVINSLGLRRDSESVAALTPLLSHADAPIAAAAAEALGKIGTPEAAAALAKAAVAAPAQTALHNARLQCAERLAAAGDAGAAAAIYRQVWSSDQPAARRLGGLVGLARVAPDRAAPLVLATLAADDPLLQATAMRLAARLPGTELTAALVERLAKLDAAGQTLLLGVLAERGDRTAAGAVAKLLESETDAVRAAAAEALAELDDASILERLVTLAATGGAAQASARSALAKITGADIDPKLLAMAEGRDTASRIEVFRALAARRTAAAAPRLLRAAAEPEAQVRLAALEALSAVAQADCYGPLVELLVAAPTPADAQAAEQAVLEVGSRLPDAQQRLAPVLAALAKTSDPAKPSLVRVLGGIGGSDALQAVRTQLTNPDAAVVDAAIRTLAAWTDASAAADLLKIAQTADSAAHRVLAMRGYLRLSGEVKDAAARLKMLEDIRPIATNPVSKRLLLATLAEAADPGALHVTASFLDDADVRAEAEVATLRIARVLVRVDPPSVRAAMKKLMDTTKDRQMAEQAAVVDEEALKAPSPAAAQMALQYDKARSDAQKAALVKRVPPGYHLACYLDCGPDSVDGAKGGPLLRLVGGMGYYWANSEQLADIRFGSVFYDGGRVIFEATGLDPKRSYTIGFTWWDCDHDTRAQSVLLASGKGENETKVLDKTKLPSGMAKQAPDEKTLAVPPELYRDGSLRISFRNEAQPNVVVSELWLWESD